MKVKLQKRKHHPIDKLSIHAKDGIEFDEHSPLNKEDDDNKVSARKSVTHGVHLVQGNKGHAMEDYIVAETRTLDNNELGLYAIFYGHSGHEVADYLRSYLFENILDEPDFLTDTEDAIKTAYVATDEEILEDVAGSRGGSTAVTAILINREKLVVANVGDSRAVVCKGGIAKQISVDHEPRKEQEAIERKGGCVVNRSGNVPRVRRVDGQLAVARVFGDGN